MAEDTKESKESKEPAEDRRDTPDFWRKWIKAAKEAAKEHWDCTREAWEEYEKKDSKDSEIDCRPYPIYWSSCKTLEPAYYSRTPKILSKRRAGVSDPTALTMSFVVERLGEYFVDCVDFDDVMQSGILDFIHGDKATTQVTYVEESEKQIVSMPLMPDGDVLIEEDGTVFEGEPEQDEAGNYFYNKEVVVKVKKIKFMPCPYDEVLHTPDAKCEAEINEKAYYFFMGEDEAKARFKGKEINWKTGTRQKRDPDDVGQERPDTIGKYVEGWECWCKSTRRVYWISDQYQDGFLDSKDDPYHLRDFFPSPKFIIGSRPSKHLYPTPVFTQLRSLIEELHDAEARISVLIKRVRRRALVDGANPELEMALNQLTDGEYVAVQNLQQILEKGGMDNLVWFIPVKELVDSIGELSDIQEKFKNEFFEWFGVPDILRGQTDPIETAAAQELKSGAAQDRFKFPKKLVARLARDSIEMMIDLALRVMDDDQIGKICNIQYAEVGHQQRFPAALEALRNDDIRMVRVDIDTDSMSFLDDQLRAAKINNGVATLSRGLEQIAQMMQTDPDYAGVGLQALLLSLEAMGLGKEFEDMVRSSVSMLIEKAKTPPEPAPPPPDYEMMKVEVARMKVETQAAAKQRELDLQQYDLQMREREAMAKARDDSMRTQIEQYKAQLDESVQYFMMQMEQQRVQIEEFKAQVNARESEMEEVRLAAEVDAKMYAAAAQTAETEKPESVQPPVLNIINAQQAPAPEPTVIPVPVNPLLGI